MLRPKSLPLLAVAVAMLFMLGCSPTLARVTPQMPPGFLEAQVPEGDLSAYLYVSQASPVVIPTSLLGDLTAVVADPRFTTLPESVEIQRLALAVGPHLDSFGGDLLFGEDRDAEMAETLLSDRDEMAVWRDGVALNLVGGDGGWANALEVALTSGNASRFQDAYPDLWDLMRLLPEKPPMKPVAAGFVRVGGELLDSLASEAGLDLGGIGQAFGAINVTDVVFAAYADVPLELSLEMGAEYFEEAGLGALFVAHSTYPGFVLSFFLRNFADRVGLEEGTVVTGQDVLSRDVGEFRLMAKSIGNTVFLSLATDGARAEALLGSVLEQQA